MCCFFSFLPAFFSTFFHYTSAVQDILEEVREGYNMSQEREFNKTFSYL